MSDVDLDEELFALAGGDDEGDVEEGEASSLSAPSSPADSLGSDAMEESDSDEGPDNDEPAARPSDVPYPLEGKFIDAADKAAIMALPQLEREAKLGERAEEMNKLKFTAELARRAAQQSGPAGDRKRKASSIEPDDSDRKTSRPKVKSKIQSTLESYKRNRHEREERARRYDDDRRNRRRSSSLDHRDRSPDIDADGDSEVDYPDYDHAPREELPADLLDFEAVRVGREYFADVCFNPGFETSMPGAFVRVGAGQDSQGRVVYKMAQIKGFTTGKPYVFLGKAARVATDQYAIVQYGAAKKEFKFDFLSNGRFTEADLDTYKQALSESGGKLPTKTSLQKKRDELKAFNDHYWTDEEITARLNKRNKYKHLLDSRNAEHSQPKLATPAEINARRIADLNNKNRISEQERVRKALIEERRQANIQRKQREKEYRLKEEQKKAEEAAKAAAKDDDLFGDGDSKAETPSAGTPKPAPEKKKEHKGLPTFRRPKTEDDIVAALNLGLEIEI